MASMGTMPMPGGWTLSMIWMRMPGQAWSEVATGFLGMWCVMMVAMMLPCLLPMLWRYRQTIRSPAGAGLRFGCTRLARLTAHVALGYFCVYLLLGLVVLATGLTIAAVARLQPVLASQMPILGGLVVLMAGVNQFTVTKLHQLRHCRHALPTVPASRQDLKRAWCHGLHLGVLCARCCAGLMVILLVLGMMELRWMALITGAITLERFGPAGEQVARASGVIAITLGVMLIGQAILPS